MITTGPFAYLPGGEIFEHGIDDARAGRRTVEAYLVAAAWPRLEAVGIAMRETADTLRAGDEALEHSAYRLLVPEHGLGAHARYLALNEELDSGLSALEREHRKRTSATAQRG